MKYKKLFITLFILLVAASVSFWGYKKWMTTSSARSVEEIMQLNLNGDDSIPKNLAQVNSKKIILFFGFAHCPDMCPITLQRMFEVLKTIPRNEVQGVFVSFDTNRDTPEKLKQFTEKFENRILAYAPRFDELQIFSDTLGIVAKTRSQANSYTYDHSGLIYILSHAGALLKTLPAESSTDAIRNAL